MGSSWACVLLYLIALPFRRVGRYSRKDRDDERSAGMQQREIYERETVT